MIALETNWEQRNVLNGELLKPDAIRDVVDRLLAVFCIEPT